MDLSKPTYEPKLLANWWASKLWKNLNELKRLFLILFVVVSSLLVSGCVSLPDPETAQVHYPDVIATLGTGEGQVVSIRQIFTSRRSPIDSLTIWLSNPDSSSGKEQPSFSFSLYSNSLPEPLFQATYQLPTQKFQGPFRISFPRQVIQEDEYFTFQLSPLVGSISIWGQPGDVYTKGDLYIDEAEVPNDLAFSLTYAYGIYQIIEDINLLLSHLWLVVLAVILLVFPGWLLIDLLNRSLKLRVHFWEKLAISTGFSLATFPLLLFWSKLVGFQWNSSISLGLIFCIGLLTAIRFFHKKSWRVIQKHRPVDFVLIAVLIASAILRVAMVRDLSFPPWVDSVHHTWITRLIQEQGSIPVSFLPDLEIQPTSYHPGFHTTLAIYHWLSGIELPGAMLAYGQILNWFAVLSTYLFAYTITKNRWVGVLAALTAGLLTPLPAYLTSWGRYTQLAGLIIFSSLVAISEKIFRRNIHRTVNLITLKRGLWKQQSVSIFFCSIGLAGLGLVHYRVAAFFGLWWAADLLSNTSTKVQFRFKFTFMLAAILLSMALIAPWTIQTVLNTFLSEINQLRNSTYPSLFYDFDLSILAAASGKYVLITSLIGLGLLVYKIFRQTIRIPIWIFGMFFMANLAAIGLPGRNLVNNISVEITLFLPISLSAGYAVQQLAKVLSNLLPGIVRIPATATGLIAIILLGSARLLPIMNPSTVLAHSSDLEAIHWIDQNIDKGDAFLINPFSWGYGLCAGEDGGYWIAPLTGNFTFPPPLLYGYGDSKRTNEIIAICNQTIQKANKPNELYELMHEYGVRYIYIGRKGGVISVDQIAKSNHFKESYSGDNIWIFEAVP